MGNALDRMRGNVRVAHRLLSYLRKLPPFCCPQATAAEYAQAGIGSAGFTCAFDRTTGKLESYAALVPAAANKLFWLGTFVSGLDFLSRRVVMTPTDAVSLCCVLLFVNNLEPCVSLMRSGRLERVWGDKTRSPGGALALLLRELYERNTGVSRGKTGSMRVQPFAAPWVETTMAGLDRLVAATKRLCDESHQKEFSSYSDAQIQMENKCALGKVAAAFAGVVRTGVVRTARGGGNPQSRQKKNAGKKNVGLIHQHVVHALAATGLLHPLRLLEHAEISDKNANAKKVDYDGDFNVIRDNVVVFFRQELPAMAATPALIENAFCEAHRKKIPKDLFFPGQFLLSLEVTPCGGRYLQRLQPVQKQDGSFGAEMSQYKGPRLSLVPEVFEEHHNPTIPVNDHSQSPQSQVDYRVLDPAVMSMDDWSAMKNGLFGNPDWEGLMRQVEGPCSRKRSRHSDAQRVILPQLARSAEIWEPYVRLRETIEARFPDLLWDGQATPPQAMPPLAANMDPLPLLQQVPELDPAAADFLLTQDILQPDQQGDHTEERQTPPAATNEQRAGMEPPIPPELPRTLLGLPQPPPEVAHEDIRLLSSWSDSNLEGGGRLVKSEKSNRRLYDSTAGLHLIMGDQFGPFLGTKDLLNGFCCEIESTLKDQAFAALNWGKGNQSWTKANGWYTMHMHSRTSWTAEYLPSVCPHRFSRVDACQLCDAIALCKGGTKVGAEVGGACIIVWAFDSKQSALDFLYAATIATCAPVSYYHRLHRVFRGRYKRRLRQLRQMTKSGSPRKEAKEASQRNQGFFLFAWRTAEGACPGMFLVGRESGEQKDSKCVRDFCIAFPERSFWDQWKQAGQKPKGAGKAVYVRPLPQDCVG